jgi:hypothetical protein
MPVAPTISTKAATLENRIVDFLVFLQNPHCVPERHDPNQRCRQKWRMAFDPKQASIIEAIATGICVGLVAYLAHLLFSFLSTA